MRNGDARTTEGMMRRTACFCVTVELTEVGLVRMGDGVVKRRGGGKRDRRSLSVLDIANIGRELLWYFVLVKFSHSLTHSLSLSVCLSLSLSLSLALSRSLSLSFFRSPSLSSALAYNTPLLCTE
jgi:hypothetical protein